jgi:hypothetical protein
MALIMYLGFSCNFDRKCAYRVPEVTGKDCTKDEKERVEISCVNEGIARNSSKIPAGGVGAS